MLPGKIEKEMFLIANGKVFFENLQHSDLHSLVVLG